MSRCCRCPGSWNRSMCSAKDLLCRMKINFVEEPETMMNDFREIAPTFVLFAPRVWEAMAADVRARVMDASPLKQGLYELGMKAGLAALRPEPSLGHRRNIAVPRAARPARLHPPAFGRDRRRRARPRHVQVLPRHGRALAHALRPDRDAWRLYAAPGGRRRSRHHRRRDGRQRRNQDRQPRHPWRRRDHDPPSQHVPRLLQESGSVFGRDQGWLAAIRRRRLFQRQTSISSSSTASRTSPRPRAASASRRNISRTS